MICFKNGGRATLFFAFCIITILHYWFTYVYNCKKENFDSSISEESIQNVASLYDEGIIELDNLVVTGKLTVGGEVVCDGNGTFGKAIIGNWPNNNKYALFSHKDRIGYDYGLMVQDNGTTYVNSSGDKNVNIRNDNNNIMLFNKDGIRFDEDNLGIEHRELSIYSNHACVDTGYPVNKWVCTLADYRSAGNYGNKWFFQRKGSDNWWLSWCSKYDPNKDTDPNNPVSGSSNCPGTDWKYVTITAIPRILYNRVDFIKTT